MFFNKTISSITGSCGLKYTVELKENRSFKEIMMNLIISIAALVFAMVSVGKCFAKCEKRFGPFNDRKYDSDNDYETTSYSSESYTDSGCGGTSYR